MAEIALDRMLLTSPEYLSLIVAAVMVCLLLLWNFILKKRVARYRYFSSSQGERYRQFFENCPDALLVVEHDGSIATANAEAAKLFKMDAQDLLAASFWNFVEAASRSQFQKQFEQCIHGKRMRCEGRVQACDGTVVPVVVNGSLQRIDDHSLVQLYIRDNSVLVEVEDQVRSLYNQLDQVRAEVDEKEKMIPEERRLVRREFITFANHQIRTPLDGIMGMAQLLADTQLNLEQHNCVYSILKSSASLLNVVQSLSEVDISDEAGKTTLLQSERVNLRTMCAALAGQYEPLAAYKGIDLRCGCQSNVPDYVVTDGRLLRQVLSTLLDNAIKYTHQGVVMLNIECRHKNSRDADIYFQVIDTGVGIDRESQSMIFEKSEPDSEDSFSRWGVSGLDLAGSSQVVEKMGGEIDLISTRGKGSTFYFCLTLPLELPESAVDVADQAKTAPDLPIGTIQDALVLVVDDNRISQKVVASMLRKAGCEVDVAGNGREAVAKIQQKHYDLVLMDCQMPVMNGYEASATIRAMPEPHRSIPIIALTAHSLEHELKACLKSGMDDHLIKPVDRQKLIDIVNKYARLGRQENGGAYKAAS